MKFLWATARLYPLFSSMPYRWLPSVGWYCRGAKSWSGCTISYAELYWSRFWRSLDIELPLFYPEAKMLFSTLPTLSRRDRLTKCCTFYMLSPGTIFSWWFIWKVIGVIKLDLVVMAEGSLLRNYLSLCMGIISSSLFNFRRNKL